MKSKMLVIAFSILTSALAHADNDCTYKIQDTTNVSAEQLEYARSVVEEKGYVFSDAAVYSLEVKREMIKSKIGLKYPRVWVSLNAYTHQYVTYQDGNLPGRLQVPKLLDVAVHEMPECE